MDKMWHHFIPPQQEVNEPPRRQQAPGGMVSVHEHANTLEEKARRLTEVLSLQPDLDC